MRNRSRRLVALAACTAAVSVWLITPTASAHNVLVDSTPADGSTVAEAPSGIELVFDQPVQNQFQQMAVLDADEAHYEEGEPEVVGETVTQAVGDLPDGEYVVSYRVVSADGHPVEGTITFVVGEPGGETEAADHDTDESAADIGAGWLIGLAALVLAGLAAVVLVAGGRRGPKRDANQ